MESEVVYLPGGETKENGSGNRQLRLSLVQSANFARGFLLATGSR